MMSKTRCIDCDYRYAVGKSPRCNICRKRRERRNDRAAKLKQKYGITLEEHDVILEAQGGVCAICGGGTSKRFFQLDHDHTTGKPRGLLCARCNRQLLPAAKNSPDILRAAADYLERPPAHSHLTERDWSEYKGDR